jgi:pyridoxal phosphate phosphatase PHOSPHO2
MCSHVYTNPGTLSPDGQLLVVPHHNHACMACPVNMCKREILQAHCQSLSTSLQRPRIAYVGDGGNDLCPAQSMGPDDILFVRAGYALEKMLQEPAVRTTVKAKVHVWTSAAEILEVLQGL